MNILFRAIITGFGLRLGSEIAKTVASKVRREDSDEEADGEEAENPEDDDLGSVTPDPPPV
jgi:hypothetical protein